MEHTIRQTFDASPERFWNMWLYDRDFFDARYRNMKCQVVERDLVEKDGEVVRQVAFTPDRNLPSVLKRILQGVTLVRERTVFDPEAKRARVSVDLPVIGRVSTFEGTYETETTGDGKFVRVWHGRVKVGVPLVGSRIEQYFIDELERTLGADHRFCSQWLAENAPA